MVLFALSPASVVLAGGEWPEGPNKAFFKNLQRPDNDMLGDYLSAGWTALSLHAGGKPFSASCDQRVAFENNPCARCFNSMGYQPT
jgi:hypothetical protein